MYPLGYRQAPDHRDQNYTLPLTQAPLTLTSKYWDADGWWGNQGKRPMCVGFAWRHWLMDEPIKQKRNTIWATRIYKQAQRIDEWPGTSYDGTSVRAGAKVLKKHGYIKNYHWAFTIDTVINALLLKGPLVVGTLWYESMFTPSNEGIISVGGRHQGGHAYLLNGIDINRGLIRLKNSWGRSWGLHGLAYISIDDFTRLLHEDGSCCTAVEIKK